MRTLGDAARINLLLSDYAAADAANKINVLGLGWQVTRILPETGLTAPHALARIFHASIVVDGSGRGVGVVGLILRQG